jgi:hypothetical protein
MRICLTLCVHAYLLFIAVIVIVVIDIAGCLSKAHVVYDDGDEEDLDMSDTEVAFKIVSEFKVVSGIQNRE